MQAKQFLTFRTPGPGPGPGPGRRTQGTGPENTPFAAPSWRIRSSNCSPRAIWTEPWSDPSWQSPLDCYNDFWPEKFFVVRRWRGRTMARG